MGGLVTTDISRWGNSLAVRIPKALADRARLAEGDTVTVEAADDGSLVIRPARARYSLEELVRGITRGNRHAETPWGEPAGDESW
jgi:antitoxin MazE